MQRNHKRAPFARYGVFAAFLAIAGMANVHTAVAASALPTGGQFAAGAGAISSAGNALTINQSSARGVINWQDFSIGQGNSVSILNGSGATLNRVTGNNISSIAGSLTSTGSVYLVNPAGVVVLPTGQVATTGTFAASTRDISTSSFMAGGVLNATGNSAGTVVNQGSITSANGDVILVGKSVTNSGQISAPNGTAALAAGDDVLLQPSGDQTVLINAGSGDVTNTGTINAAQAELNAAGGNVYALASSNGGIIRATGTATKDGHVYLTGGNDVTVDGAVSASNADGSGGTIQATGGAATGTLNIAGAVNASATNASAKGGRIVATAAAVNVGAAAKVAANGGTNGGTVLLGGDRHGGSDPTVALSATPIANAQQTNVAAGAQISADAGANGNGGNVVVWSDNATSYAGAITAHGGNAGGNGGFVEVSGKRNLAFTGTVDASAPFGANGTLLLDPSDLTITSADSNTSTSGGGGSTETIAPNGSGSSTVSNTTIQTALASEDVIITTVGSTSDGTTGNIYVNAPISWASNQSLTIHAANTISFGSNASTPASGVGSFSVQTGANGGITTTGTGNITLIAEGDSSAGFTDTGTQQQHFGIMVGAPISAAGGTITIQGTHASVAGTAEGQILFAGSGATVTNTTGDIDFLTATNMTIGANVTNGSSGHNGGNINLVSTGTSNRISVANTITVETYGTGSVLVQADLVRLGSGLEQAETGQIITDTTGKVTVQPASSGPILIGSNGVNPILADYDVALITTGTLVIGSNGSAINANAGAPLVALTDGSASVTSTVERTGFAGGTVTGLTIEDNLDANASVHVQHPAQATRIPLASVNNLELLTGSSGYVTENDVDDYLANSAITVGSGGTGGLAIVTGTYIDMSGVSATAGGGGLNPNRAGTLAMQLTGTPTSPPVDDGSPSTAALQFGGDPLSGSLTIGTVNGVSGIHANGGKVYLANAGTVVQSTGSANAIVAAGLDLEGAGAAGSATPTTSVTGAYTLNNTLNAISSFSGNVGSLTLYDNVSLQINTAANTGGIASGVTGYAGAVQIVDNGTLTIASGAPVADSAGSVKLEDQVFVNNDSTSAFNVTGGGTWHVYSQDPRNDTDGGLTSTQYNFVQYNAANFYATPFTTADAAFSASGSPTGNGFLYTVPVVVSETLTKVLTKPYDGTNSMPVGQTIASGDYSAVTYTINGTADTRSGPNQDSYSYTNFTGNAGLTFHTVHAATGITIDGYTASTINAHHDSNNVTVYGETVNFTNNLSGTITAIPLTVTGTKVYSGTQGFVSTQLSASGGISGDTFTITAGTTGTASTDANVGSHPGSTLTASGLGFSIASTTNSSVTSDYSFPSTGTLTITAAPLTITANPQSRVYGNTGGTIVQGSGVTTNYTPTGLVTGETIGSVTLTATNTSTAATTGVSTQTGAITPSAAQNNGAFNINNYSITYTAGNVNITPAPLTVTANSTTKIYGQTVTFAGTEFTVGAGQLQNSDTVTSATLTSAGAAATAQVSGSPYSIIPTAAVGTGLSNYSISYVNGTLTLSQKPLTITASNQSRVYGPTGGTLVLGANSTTQFTTSGLTNSDTVTSVTLTGTNASTLATTGVGTLTGAITPSVAAGSGIGNYAITYNPGNVTITAAPLTITANNQTKTYGNTFTFTGTEFTPTGLVNGDTVGTATLTSLGSPSSATVGGSPYAINVSAATGGTFNPANYNISYVPGTMTVSALTLTLGSGTKVYNGNNTVLASSINSLSNLAGGDSLGTTLTLTGSGTTTSANVGSYTGPSGASTFSLGTLTLGGSSAANYTLQAGTYTITAAPLTITGTKVYNTTTGFTTGQLAISGGVNGETVALTGGTGTSSSANVGSYGGSTITGATISVTGGNALAGNYSIPGTGTLTITPAPLTITANSTSKTYGSTLTFAGTEFTPAGLLGGQTVGSVTLTSTGAPATATVAGSPYAIVASAATGGTFTPSNYTISYTNGVLTVNPLPINVTGTRVYDGTTGVTGTILTITDKVNGDTVALTGNGTLSAKDVGNRTITALGTLTLTGANASNYTTVGYTSSVTVTPFAVNLHGTRLYDGIADGDSSILSVTNAFSGDSPTVASGTSTIASKNVGDRSITNFGTLVLGNNALGDYTLVGATGDVIVTPLALTVTAVPDSKVYDGTTTSSKTPIITVGTLKGTDTGSFIQVFGGKNVGTSITLTPSGTVNDGFGGADYIVTYVPIGSGIITPRPVNLLGTRVFDGTTTANASILNNTNTVPGDSLTVASGSGIAVSPAVGNESLSSFGTLALGGSSAGNYTFIGGTGLVIITPQVNISDVSQQLQVTSTQTGSGQGTMSNTTVGNNGGLITLTANQNGIVTGTIATNNGVRENPDSELGCTIGGNGCINNGVGPSAGAPAAN